jgi:hypothetical protein
MPGLRCAAELNPVHSPLLAVISVEIAVIAESSFSTRKPDKMRALSATHTLMEP